MSANKFCSRMHHNISVILEHGIAALAVASGAAAISYTIQNLAQSGDHADACSQFLNT